MSAVRAAAPVRVDTDPDVADESYYRLLSIHVTVRCERRDIARALRLHLAPFACDGPDVTSMQVSIFADRTKRRRLRPALSVYVGLDLKFEHRDPAKVLDGAIWAIHAAIPARTRDFLLLHSAALVRGDGALLLPAAMDHGKSSLALALLMQGGFRYLSDELGVLDPVTRRAYPFPKLISLDADALRFFPELNETPRPTGLSRRLPQRYLRPGDVGAGVAGPTAIRWLAFPSDEWDGPPTLEAISGAEAAVRMAGESFNLHRYEERGVILLTDVAASAEAFVLRGGTPRERAALLAERLV